jgi:hypothetical protein
VLIHGCDIFGLLAAALRGRESGPPPPPPPPARPRARRGRARGQHQQTEQHFPGSAPRMPRGARGRAAAGACGSSPAARAKGLLPARACRVYRLIPGRRAAGGIEPAQAVIVFSPGSPCFPDSPRARGTGWRPPTSARRAATAGGAAGSGREHREGRAS